MDLMDKIGKALVLAENAGTEEEAQAAMDLAYRLSVQNGIDLQAARARQADKTKREQPIMKRVVVADPHKGRENHLAHKCELLIGIATYNNLKVTIAHSNRFVNLFGFPSDIDVVIALYNSLVIQMVGAASKKIRRGAHKEIRYSATRYMNAKTYRGEFYRGFHERVTHRLAVAWREAQAQQVEVERTDAETGETTTEHSTGALMLLERTEEVGAFFERESNAKGTWKGAQRSGHWGSSIARSDGEDAGRDAVINPAKGLPRRGKELADR